MKKSTNTGPVARNALGQVVKGSGAINPGGFVEGERIARDLLRQALSAPEMLTAWKLGYLNQLIAENPIILKDFADRIGGKPKERIELSEDPDAPLSREMLSLEELKAVARAQLEKERPGESLANALTVK